MKWISEPPEEGLGLSVEVSVEGAGNLCLCSGDNDQCHPGCPAPEPGLIFSWCAGYGQHPFNWPAP